MTDVVTHLKRYKPDTFDSISNKKCIFHRPQRGHVNADIEECHTNQAFVQVKRSHEKLLCCLLYHINMHMIYTPFGPWKMLDIH